MTAGTVERCGGGIARPAHGDGCPAYWARCGLCDWAQEFSTARYAQLRLRSHTERTHWASGIEAWLQDMSEELGARF